MYEQVHHLVILRLALTPACLNTHRWRLIALGCHRGRDEIVAAASESSNSMSVGNHGNADWGYGVENKE